MELRHWWLAVIGSVGFGLLYVVTVLWDSGQRFDDKVLAVVLQWGAGPVGSVLPWVARRLLPTLLVGVLLCAGVAAPRRRRIASATLIIVGSVVVSRLLRDAVLWRPLHGGGYGYPANTFPSTHMTIVVALVVALWLLAPRRPRWLAPVLTLAVLLAMIGNVVGNAHRPSDTLGSILLVGAVTGVVRGVMCRGEPASS